MKILQKPITCDACKATFYTNTPVSQYIEDRYLDLKPIVKDKLAVVKHVCPNCGYTWYLINNKKIVADSIDEDIYSIYKKAFDTAINNTEKYDALSLWAWDLEYENKNDDALKIRKQILDVLAAQIQDNPRIELVFMFIENCRLLGEFDDAQKLIDNIDKDVEDHKDSHQQMYDIFQYMKNLVAKKDTLPHLLSEVKR